MIQGEQLRAVGSPKGAGQIAVSRHGVGLSPRH
jgi:hypothetical protein